MPEPRLEFDPHRHRHLPARRPWQDRRTLGLAAAHSAQLGQREL